MDKQVKTVSAGDTLTFPMYLSWKNGVIEVVGEVKEDLFDMGEVNYIPGKGYISDGIVFKYYAEKPKKVTSPEPYFYVKQEPMLAGGVHIQTIYKFPLTREESVRIFGIENLIDYSYQRIVNETSGDEVLYDEALLNDMNAARSKYIPDVNKDDDCLKKLVKYMILKKDVDINRYKSVMDTPYALTNMKSALISKTKMSITYFMMWVELLGVDFVIGIEDNNRDRVDPMKESLVYRSKDNSTYTYDAEKYELGVVPKNQAPNQIWKDETILNKINEQNTIGNSSDENESEETE